jgi:hypothetical protein
VCRHVAGGVLADRLGGPDRRRDWPEVVREGVGDGDVQVTGEVRTPADGDGDRPVPATTAVEECGGTDDGGESEWPTVR